MKPALPVALALILGACGATTPDRFDVTTPEITERIGIAYRTVEIRDVSLPTYAEADEITRQDPSGTLVSDGAVLWADTPSRAVGLELTRHLTTLTRARVASEPWPFEELPEARLEVRFETMLARANGTFQITGQYFLSTLEDRPERSGLFDLSVPIASEAPSAIADARGAAIIDLAKLLARRALR